MRDFDTNERNEGFSLKLSPMGSAVSLQLIWRWLHPESAMDYFGGGKRLCRSLHRCLVDGYMRSCFLTIWDVRAIA